MNEGTEIIVAVSGGIAAYKAAELVSDLVQSCMHVTVVMTEAAHEFIGAATFAALTGRPVATRIFDERFPLGAHIELARRADILCVVPATADSIAKLANGFAGDLLSALYLCFTGKVLVAPAMNNQMWAKPSVQRNIELLRQDGVTIVGPAEGWLSCRERGFGRMESPDMIRAAIDQL
ncbi:MAG: phosphopantothenoylcysteine decarboxylase [Planctomycetales bacterium]|nr:phosphopantothenoylcysteine decarboxylase [Planctomycetales bacterium]